MIVYRVWFRKAKHHFKNERWGGWYLFGLVPLFIRQESFIDITDKVI